MRGTVVTIIETSQACQRGRVVSSWTITRTPWFRAGNGRAATRPAGRCTWIGSGAWTSALRDPSGFTRLGAQLHPHKMNGQHGHELPRVATTSLRYGAAA